MSQREIALISDSICNIPQALLDQYQIPITMQYVIWGEEQLREGVDISIQEFYSRLQTDPIHPQTSQPTPHDFAKLIDQAEQDGAKEAVIITVSKEMSGTYASATQAANLVTIPLHIVDSRSAAMGFGWQVLAAARAREAGGGVEEMIAATNKTRERCKLTLTVDTLEYLHKGGRIGGAQKLIGTALNLKPQLYVDHKLGRIMPGERTRTRSKALEYVYDSFFEEMVTSKKLRIAVMHVAAEEEAKTMARRVQDEYQPEELLMIEIAPVVGVHVGPGSVGICGYYED